MTTTTTTEGAAVAPSIMTLAPAPTHADPAEVAAYIVRVYGAKGDRYAAMMTDVNRAAGCEVAALWWEQVGAAIAEGDKIIVQQSLTITEPEPIIESAPPTTTDGSMPNGSNHN
jgi:hypothetical protein